MLDYIIERTNEFLAGFSKAVRKKKGQFFTSPETARFMSGMFDLSGCGDSVSILDPGAGSGILSAALIERLLSEKPCLFISLVCYETDPDILPLLKDNLEHMKQESEGRLEYELKAEDYILSQDWDFNCNADTSRKFDFVISNPPYLKIGKDDPRSLAMSDVVHGAPNLYFLFASMSLFNLRRSSEMVCIIPRSWTSGAYFRAFRKYLLSEGKLRRIHLFVSRSKVFDAEEVLQETMIIKVAKEPRAPESVLITSGGSGNDFSDISSLEVPYNAVVSGNELYVCLPTSKAEMEVIQKISIFTSTLPDSGLKMKTGIVVDFRQEDELRTEPGEHTIPLFYSQHIRDGKVTHQPSGKGHDWILDRKPGLIQKNKNYVFVKRFTAKEERRRLQCGIYSPHDFGQYEYIGTQNKINFVDRADGSEMDRKTTYGVYALLNSTLFDMYYRILNGSTQVNSTEMNSMPFPPADIISKIGEEMLSSRDLSTVNCDRIINEVAYG